MSIAIEGKPGSGKSLFADWFGENVLGYPPADFYMGESVQSVYRCIVTQRSTDRTVRYICFRHLWFGRYLFVVRKLVYRHGRYYPRGAMWFRYIKDKGLSPIPIVGGRFE